MAKKKKDTAKAFSIQGFDAAHYRRTEAYTTAIENLYAKATTEISNAVASGTYDPDKPFAFSDYPRIASYVKQVMSKLASNVQAVISEGSRREWLFACQKNDEFIKSIMDTAKLTKKRLEKMQDRNLDALKSFQTRKVEGLDLSARVWKYTDQYKEQLELGLDVGLGEGRSAQQLARDVKQNLKDPNRLFRRVRDKRGNLHLSKAAKAFHPGTGVYRSSVKNAQRLTRSEINMAYRESDYLRWQQLDFVVGFDVHRSNHEPLCKCDLCAQLTGRYPKTFKFKGWHPQCMCYATPVLMDDDTFDANELGDLKAALRGTSYRHLEAKNAVTDVPDNFKEWVESHKEQQQGWKSVPYFIRDNFVNGLLEEGLKANVLPPPDPFTPLLQEVMPQVEQARALCKEWGLTAASGAIESGIAQKSIEQVKAGIAQATDEALDLEKGLNAWMKQIQQLLPVAKSYGINVDTFTGYVTEATGNHAKWAVNRAKWQQAVKDLENAIEEAKDNVKLSSLLVDVADAKAKYGSEAVHKVYDAVEKKLADISSIDGSLEYMKKKLEFEINWVSTYKKYSTWEIAAQAYQKKLDEVNYQLDKKAIEQKAQPAITYLLASKSLKGKALCKKFQNLIATNTDIPMLQAALGELNAKYQEQMAKDNAEKAKAALSRFAVNEFKGKMDWSDTTMYDQKRRDAAMWATEPSRADIELRGVCMKTWANMSNQEKHDAWDYTEGSSFINEPLRKLYYSGRKGDRGVEAGERLAKVIDRSAYNFDMWLVRGVSVKAFEALFSISTSYIMNMAMRKTGRTEDISDEINSIARTVLLGKKGTEHAFSSCGNARGSGFSSSPVVYNIYCPKGTKMLYMEPFSYFGHGVNGNPADEMNAADGVKWDGVSPQSGFGHEAECLIQKETTFRITKVEYTGSSPYDGKWFIDLYVVNQ